MVATAAASGWGLQLSGLRYVALGGGSHHWAATTQDGVTYFLTVDDARAAAPEVTRALVAAGADVLSIAEVQHSLEDVYLELIDEDVEAAR